MTQVFYWFVLSMVTGLSPESRYRFEIADAISEVSEGDARMASLLVSVAWHESNFRPWAVNHKDPLHSTGLFQTPRSITPRDIYGQAIVARKMIADSLSKCGDLTLYASGDCRFGSMASTARVSLAERLESSVFFQQTSLVGSSSQGQ